MKLRRTANAGVLLVLDGVSILLDGVCREVRPYPATPPEERTRLSESWPDVIAFTHTHKDHYDPVFANAYMTLAGGVILGSPEIAGATMEPVTVGSVQIMPVPSRHIGGAGKTVHHTSYIIRGTKCVWFLGDSAPIQWKGRTELPGPDVLIVPYAYANTPAGWSVTKGLQAHDVVLLHMPDRDDRSEELWSAVEATVDRQNGITIPSVGEEINFL